METNTTVSPLMFKYIALPHGFGGRGGVLRFFLLNHNIPFEENLIDPGTDWGIEKQRLLKTGENPCGTVPIVYSEDSKKSVMIQHIAIARYLARMHDVTSGDPYQDYVQDLVADEYQGFRDKWVETTFSGTEEDKAKYGQDDLPKLLDKFNKLYAKYKTHDTFLSVSAKTKQPLWGDAAVFGLLRDNVLSGYRTVDDYKEYPNLAALYKAYHAIPAVNNWIESKKEE